jgi:hypothetical protein
MEKERQGERKTERDTYIISVESKKFAVGKSQKYYRKYLLNK